MDGLGILDLSNNNLTGEIPHCMGDASNQLIILNLQSNNLNGIIPSTFSKCESLEYLDFSDNQLEGLIPKSLSKCLNLTILNLGNNNFKDIFPYWLDSLPHLEVLNLRYNSFYGHIHHSSYGVTHPFPKLQVLDLSNNNFRGKLPLRYIKHFVAMVDTNESTQGSPRYIGDKKDGYKYSTTLVFSGLQLNYVKIITSMSTFDVSKNNFEGEIPDFIGRLHALRGLNVSHNLLTGHIPPSIGSLSLLDYLDLSSNRLTGEIPQELVSITFLEIFNVSDNLLVGRIPNGYSFDTFSPDSYKGNIGLCGPPLPKCKPSLYYNNTTGNQDTFEEESVLSMWRVILIGFGSGITVGVAWGYYMCSIEKPIWIFRLVKKLELTILELREEYLKRS